jgi:hypothetical protein
VIRTRRARLLGFGWLTRVGVERNCRDEDERGERDRGWGGVRFRWVGVGVGLRDSAWPAAGWSVTFRVRRLCVVCLRRRLRPRAWSAGSSRARRNEHKTSNCFDGP